MARLAPEHDAVVFSDYAKGLLSRKLVEAASGAPVVPAAIVGSRQLRLRGRVTVVFGEPLHVVRNRKSDDDDLEKGAAQIMQRIRALEESIR